nr:uncharacterized mitochondrial protein AtMg00810-like [Tanacetum cinerariifolium]
MNYQPVIAGNQSNPNAGFQDKFDAEKRGEESDQQYVLFPVWSFGSTNPQNNDGDAVFNEKKPKSEVNVSLSSKFEDLSDNSINEVNAAGTLVSTVGQISPNSTNTFSAAGPSNAVASPTHGKSSSIDASQLPEYPDMPELEDITYSDDEDDVGAEADFNNLETCITVSPIPTTRAHKDHPVTQIIGDLSLATQTRSITRVAKYQGSEDPDHLNNVYKVVKALYGLHQAPRAWYETLANYLLETSFQRGKIDQTLFIKRQKGDILLVQIFVDDIIFGETNKDLCKSFEKLVKEMFQMSSMGELTFFLGLQVKQKKDGIFISHDKYVASTPIDTEKPMLKDPDGEDVDVHTYRSMIGSLMYLTSSRPDIMFAICAYAHFKVTSKASHLHAVKRIFRYLKGKPHLGLWYLKDSPFDLVAYSDSDYAGASLDRKSTTGGCQFLGCRLISCAMDSESTVRLWVVLSGIKSLQRMLQVTTILSAGYLTTQQMVLNSPCLTHIKNWLVQKQTTLGVNTPRCDEDRLELTELMVFLLPKVEKVGIRVSAVNLQVFAVRLMLLIEGFHQIIDFLNGSSIKYALTVNPNIYVSCIKQFWTTVAVKTVNDIIRLQALVDKKKVVVTEDIIHDALRLDDAEGVECLPNEEIFEELARMGYEKPSTKLMFYKAFFSSQWKFLIHTILQCMSAKRTSWNEFSSLMASNVICLSSGEVHGEEVNDGDAAEREVSDANDEVPTVAEEPSIPSPTPPTPPPQPSHDIPSTS